MNGPHWIHNTNWKNASASACTYYGIVCNQYHHPIEINLSHNNLSGYCGAISSLTMLKKLDLSNNAIIGDLPSSLAGHAHLEVINLANNEFTGPISYILETLPMLSELSIENNHFHGSIHFLSTIRMATKIILSHNHFLGYIPQDISGLTRLRELRFDHNQITGYIPYSIKWLSSLTYLDLSHNNIDGLLPIFPSSLTPANIHLEGNAFQCPVPPGHIYDTANCTYCHSGHAPVGDDCVVCQAGYTSNGTEPCTPCPWNTIAPTPQSHLCSECPAGTFAWPGSASCTTIFDLAHFVLNVLVFVGVIVLILSYTCFRKLYAKIASLRRGYSRAPSLETTGVQLEGR